MHYISVAEAAKRIGKTTRRVQQMIAEGRIDGVVRLGVRTYAIPEGFTVKPSENDQKASKSLPREAGEPTEP